MTAYLSIKLLEETFCTGTRTVALFAGEKELTGKGYRPQKITFQRKGSIVTNSGEIPFGWADVEWGQVTHFGVRDEDGNMLIFDQLGEMVGGKFVPKPRNIDAGEQFVFRVGQVVVEFPNV